MIRFVLGGIVIAFLLVMVIGGLTGRVRAQSCCGVGTPDRDVRMRSVDADSDDLV